MKSLVFITIVLICKTIAKTESRDFCEEFEGNGYKVDYTFQHIYNTENQEKPKNMVIVFVIGYDYWTLDYNKGDDTMIIVSNGTTDIFGSHYSSAMTFTKTDLSYIYGFLRRNDSVIEWRELKSSGDSVDYSSMKSTLLSTSNPLEFPQDFKPDFSYWLNIGNMSYYQTFVSQKKMAQKQEFIRDYYVLDFNVFTEKPTISPLSPQVLANQTRTNTSYGEDFIITCYGTLGLSTYPGDHMYVVFHQKSNSIDYCLQNGTDRQSYSLDDTCLIEPKILFDCSVKDITNSTTIFTPKDNYSSVYVLIIILIVVLIVILLIIIFVFCCKTKKEKIPKRVVFKDGELKTQTDREIKTIELWSEKSINSVDGNTSADSQQKDSQKTQSVNHAPEPKKSVDPRKGTKQLSLRSSMTSKLNTSSKSKSKTSKLDSTKKQSPKK